MGELFQLDGKRLQEQYIRHLSGFMNWDQLDHADNWILFPENMGEYLSLDEVCLSHGELYTVLTNKGAKGQKGALLCMVKGTVSENVISVLQKTPYRARKKVKEVTLDLAPTMERIAKRAFPKANLVSDRFHVQQLVGDAVQQLRIQYRWDAIDQENKEIALAKETDNVYTPHILENGDTMKQLLARSRYLLFKQDTKWTPAQRQRSEILFRHYPLLEKAYQLSRRLSYIFSNTKDKGIAFTRLARWYEEVEKSGLKAFSTVSRSIQNHYLTILNYFDNRNTNASAESFNAKIKALRAQFRGVRNVQFFMFRLMKIYA